MKNIFRTMLLVTTFLIIGCSDDDNQVVGTSEVVPALLETNDSSINLFDLNSQNLSSNNALTIVWEEATYSTQAEISYEIEVASDANFTEPYRAGVTADRTFSWTVADLNVAAQNAKLPIESENPLFIRVNSFLGNTANVDIVNNQKVNSNVISVNVTPYFAYIFRDYYLVGNATMADWNNNNNNPPVFRTEEDPNKYTYTGFFSGSPNQMKLLEILGQWQPQWGTNDGSLLSGNPATQDGDPGEINIPGPDGYYTLTTDYSNLTFTIMAFTEESSAPEYSAISLTGTAGDVALTQSTFDSHIWNVSGVDLSTGVAKFVAGDGTEWGNTNEFHGQATATGGDIPVTERNYNIWFNDLTGDYMIIPTF